MSEPLRGLRILVPPSRLDRNPLIVMLERNGAEVVVFPRLQAGPVERAPIAEAAARLEDYDWVIFGGGESVENLCAELDAQGRSLDALRGRVATIGSSALGALRQRGRRADHRPLVHTAPGVVEGMLPVEGRRVLILRGAPAREKLPRLLTEHSAQVDALIGHTVVAEADRASAADAFGRRVDLLALANPATARHLHDAMQQLELDRDRCLAGVTITAIGEATGEAARGLGLLPDLVAGGRLKHLVAALVELAGRD